MANDRCWLVCGVCCSRVLLAKHFGEDWHTKGGATYYPDEDGHLNVESRTNAFSFGEGVEDFIEHHGGLIHGYPDRADRQPFAVEYESRRDRVG